ncbi:MAG: hypothetical protein ACI4P1_04575 [Erysipelotrichaceae bacterium]
MNNISEVIGKIIFDKYRFNIVVLIILCVICLISYLSLKNIFIFYVLIFLLMILGIVALMWFMDMKKMHEFINNIKESEYKIVDNTIFTEDRLYSYTFNRFITLPYSRIKRVTHKDNIFEKVRQPYKGNHSVTVETGVDEEIVVLKVEDKEKATKVVNFITTKNHNIEAYGIDIRKETYLSDLDNWQVNSRF